MLSCKPHGMAVGARRAGDGSMKNLTALMIARTAGSHNGVARGKPWHVFESSRVILSADTLDRRRASA